MARLRKEPNSASKSRKNSEVQRHKEIQELSDEEIRNTQHRHLTYRKDLNNINKDVEINLSRFNENEDVKRSFSFKKNKKKHHRHHHYQHYKKPERIIMSSSIETFSIIQNVM